MIRYNSTTRIYNPPLVKWFGGKARQSNQIIEMIPTHTRFLDVCLGGGTVSLNKPKSKIEILSDTNPDLINLYQQVQTNGPDLARLAGFVEPSADVLWLAHQTDSPDPMLRALSFLIKNRLSYRGFGKDDYDPNNHQWSSIPKRILRAHKRLKRAKILEADLFDQIKGARSQTFVFLDPPYLDQHYLMHQQIDHHKLLKAVIRSKAKILLCANASTLYTEALTTNVSSKWHCTKRPMTVYCGNLKRRITECFWRNYND